MVDHDMNCPGMGHGPPGTQIDPKTVISEWKHGESLRHCPCGPPYGIEFRVGSHPRCPIHGDLIAEVGYIPHEQEDLSRLKIKHVTPWMLICFGASAVGAIALGFGMRRRTAAAGGPQPDGSGGV